MNLQYKVDSQCGSTYLLYRAQGELYATPLAMIAEIFPYQSPRPVPNTHRNYLGLINLRNEVVSVVDIRIWFSDQKHQTKCRAPKALIAVQSRVGNIAVAVDSVEGVYALDGKDVESSDGIPGSLSSGGIIGIGKFRQGLATLLDLQSLCSSLDVVSENKDRLAS